MTMKRSDFENLIEKTIKSLPKTKTFRAKQVIDKIDLCDRCLKDFLKATKICCLSCAVCDYLDKHYDYKDGAK